MSPVTYRSENAVGTITLDKPPANSYDLAMMTEFSAAVEHAIEERALAVIVRSASEKFFSAGADIKRFLEEDTDGNMEMIHTSQAAFRRMASASPVFIAHISGHALGGGLEIALACDLRYADRGTYKLGTPEVTLGILPGNGGTQRLTRLLGGARAMDLTITGRTISPEEALQIGLVSELFAPEEGAERVQAVAQRFASGPPLALAAIKRCVYEGGQLSLVDGLALEASEIDKLFRSDDGTEGLTAFVEKRKPKFVGT